MYFQSRITSRVDSGAFQTFYPRAPSQNFTCNFYTAPSPPPPPPTFRGRAAHKSDSLENVHVGREKEGRPPRARPAKRRVGTYVTAFYFVIVFPELSCEQADLLFPPARLLSPPPDSLLLFFSLVLPRRSPQLPPRCALDLLPSPRNTHKPR